ncbi:MAG: flagellar hook-associated protein FlgK, partial [Planctomycetes bacterium]|nr:flagellar hook-associated protein FlgK [Planctomycetota bacterium]
DTLAADIRRLDSRVRQARKDVNDRIGTTAGEINLLTHEIARLDVQIVQAEGGGASPSDAGGLRDRRQQALTKLAELIDVRSVEQATGAVNVFAGGEFLIFDGRSRPVKTVTNADRGLLAYELRIEETDAPLQSAGGELGGLLSARDDALGGFLDRLDEFTQSLLFEFNRVYAGGQGLNGHQQITAEHAILDAAAPLDQAGLPFTPDNGGFQVLLLDRQTGQTTTTDIRVALNGLDDDATLDDLVQQLDAIDGLAASITPEGRLDLRVESDNLEFSFADDTSGLLASLGINTFFTGTTARDVNTSLVVRSDPTTFAASRAGIGQDADNAETLAVLLETPLDSQGGSTLFGKYESIVAEVTQNSGAVRASNEGYRVFKNTLEGQKLATSGVNLDEEAVRMISFQRTFQASARFISTVNELLGTLINL